MENFGKSARNQVICPRDAPVISTESQFGTGNKLRNREKRTQRLLRNTCFPKNEAAPRPSPFRGVRQFAWNHLESVSCHFCGQGFWKGSGLGRAKQQHSRAIAASKHYCTVELSHDSFQKKPPQLAHPRKGAVLEPTKRRNTKAVQILKTYTITKARFALSRSRCRKSREETKVWFFKRVVLANVPSFRLLVPSSV